MAKHGNVRPEDVRNHFDHHAPHYDNPVTAFIGERELRVIRPLVPPGSTVLDYGCGTGRTTLDLLRRGCRVTAYDLSGGMLALARARARGKLCSRVRYRPGAISWSPMAAGYLYWGTRLLP